MRKDKKEEYIFLALLGIPILWFSIRVAPYLEKGLWNVIANLDDVTNHPFKITWCDYSIRSVFLFMLIYLFGVAIYVSSMKNYRRNEEYGSAKWANSKQVNSKYANKEFFNNKILTQNVHMGLDGKVHKRNINTLIIGGSGAGKTRFFAVPNLMQCNTSYVVLDPKGEIAKTTSCLLEKEGYVIKILDLKNMHKSHGYNPFHYIERDSDVLRLITNLIKNTTKKEAQAGEQFWEHAETAFLQALMLYLYNEAPEDEQNFAMIMEMMAAAEVREDDEEYQSPLDELFERLYMRDPYSVAYKQYQIARKGAGKTVKSILISAGVRLAPFNLPELIGLTNRDELELEKLGERKTALFLILPEEDSTFNFLIGMLYTQMFQILYRRADNLYNGELPIPVQVVMDEFANVALPEEFDHLMSTIRSKRISVSIFLQNLTQIKGIYKDSWESIIGNCDELVYLGGNEKSTHSFISEYLGKETIYVNTFGKTHGMHGNYTTNYQQTGRELLTPDEVRKLENDYMLLFMRGEDPVFDKKYNVMKHPRIKDIAFGGAPEYEHGIIEHNIEDWQNILLTDNEYELYSEADMEEYFFELKQKENEKNE